MNIFFRILLAVYAFCLAVISAVTMYIIMRTDAYTTLLSYLEEQCIFQRGFCPENSRVYHRTYVFCDKYYLPVVGSKKQ